MFTGPTERPIDPRVDNREWAELLKEAAVREARLHDARHTAATVLLVLGISQRAIMGLMGWSNNAMTTRYQHLTPDLRRDIAHQVDELLWTRDETKMRPLVKHDLPERTFPLIRGWPGAGSNHRPSDSGSNRLVRPGRCASLPANCGVRRYKRSSVAVVCCQFSLKRGDKVGR